MNGQLFDFSPFEWTVEVGRLPIFWEQAAPFWVVLVAFAMEHKRWIAARLPTARFASALPFSQPTPSLSAYHSIRKLSTGLRRAARQACTLTVSQAMSRAPIPAAAKYHHCHATR